MARRSLRKGGKNPKLSAALKGNKNASKGGSIALGSKFKAGGKTYKVNGVASYQTGFLGRKKHQTGISVDNTGNVVFGSEGLPKNARKVRAYYSRGK